MRKFKYIVPVLALMSFAACTGGGEGTEGDGTATDSTAVAPVEEVTPELEYVGEVVAEKGGLKLHKLNNSPEYVTAKLSQTAPVTGDKVAAGEVGFSYTVENYELGAQTVESIPLANSGKGQHIHLILNNEPYSAHYEPVFNKTMEPGNYVALSFLSRSYHESVKNADAYTLTQFKVGDDKSESVDLSGPLMFYSRPKGTYKGEKDTKYLLLDFFLINVNLSADGYKVRATLNGTDFLFDTWEPLLVEGLPMGENTVKLELLDAEGNLVPAPFNPVERTVTLAADEGM